ncbi:MAG TPA: peptide deformylase [Candidatus Atribacteria bacterium]|nr:peptide deformylase [Candidatus Atribacteria bacterium]
MAILEIKVYGDPVLREKSQPVEKITPEILNIIKDMTETMYAASGVGLAAPQVGVLKRIIIVDGGEEGVIALINPKIVDKEGESIAEEGCLSLPDIYANVKRSSKVTVEALDLDGEQIKITKEDLIARALQHEIDHLEGTLFIDRIGRTKRQLLLNQLAKKNMVISQKAKKYSKT